MAGTGRRTGKKRAPAPTQREAYVEGCLQRMYEGAQEIERLKEEYTEVTDELLDMDELRRLDSDTRGQMAAAARRILECERTMEDAEDKRSRMSEQTYLRMERFEGEFLPAIRKFSDTEEYHRKIKSDLRRLENERNAFYMRQDDLEKTLTGTRDISIWCLVALCAVLAVLFVLHRVMEFNVTPGYLAALLLAAVAIVYLYFRNSGAAKELRITETSINRLIMLQNTVKIRYVNNRNLLDFYCMKYGVDKCSELKKLVKQYETEKKERAKLTDVEQTLSDARQELSRLLTSCNLRRPARFRNMPEILVSAEEESLYRHELLGMRMKLRDRMDYNQDDVIDDAKEEIRHLAEMYPEYADEITAQVDAFIRERDMRF